MTVIRTRYYYINKRCVHYTNNKTRHGATIYCGFLPVENPSSFRFRSQEKHCIRSGHTID